MTDAPALPPANGLESPAPAPQDAPPQKFCPHIPPIPTQSKLTGSKIMLQFSPCLGEQCAIFEKCQGEPEDWSSILSETLDVLSKAPWIGPYAKDLRARLFDA